MTSSNLEFFLSFLSFGHLHATQPTQDTKHVAQPLTNKNANFEERRMGCDAHKNKGNTLLSMSEICRNFSNIRYGKK